MKKTKYIIPIIFIFTILLSNCTDDKRFDSFQRFGVFVAVAFGLIIGISIYLGYMAKDDGEVERAKDIENEEDGDGVNSVL